MENGSKEGGNNEIQKIFKEKGFSFWQNETKIQVEILLKIKAEILLPVENSSSEINMYLLE
jgi:hypothetical protein